MMTRSSRITWVSLMAAGLSLLGGIGRASALPSDELVIMERGGVVDQIRIPEGNPSGQGFESGEHFFFEFPNLAFDARFRAVQIGFTEPGTTTLSDTVVIEGMTQSGSILAVVGAASDVDGVAFLPPNPLPISTTIPETGQPQNLTRLLFPGFVAGQEPARIFFRSDVPEPRALAVLASGLAALAALAWGRRRP
jgi:hypothetical protein